MKKSCAILVCLLSTACSTTGKKTRIYLDSSTHADNPPAWVNSTKVRSVASDSNGAFQFRATHSVRGDERISACYDLAKLNLSENLILEISNDIKGRIDNAMPSLSENAEVILGKVRSSEFKATVQGLTVDEEYFERYLVNDTERVDCHVLGIISTSDYNKLKQKLVNHVETADPRIKDAVTKNMINFFDSEKSISKTSD